MIRKGDEKVIGEMKREALQSLRGKWGLGVGSTLLYGILSYILSLFATLIVIIPFVLLFMLLGDSIDLFEGETVTIGFTVTFVILYGLMMFMSLMSYGITAYGYTNVFLNISRRKGATIDALFEGFRGFRRMMNAAKAMILIFLYSGIWIPFVLLIIVGLLGDETGDAGEGSAIAFFVLLFVSFIVIIIASFSYVMTYYVMIDNPEYGVLQAMKESKKIMKGHKMDLFLLWLSFIGWGILAMIPFGFGLLWLCPYISTTTAHFYQYVSEKA
ncbi:Integral membrane protein [Bacillus pseudomycoides]|nr:Integral membrane protein [Bacillus pseudomycoides]